MRAIVRGVVVSTMVVVLAACSSGGSTSKAAHPTTSPTTVTTLAPGATTTAPAQTSGTRTVLSPLGLNIRGQASKVAPVLGTVGQGATLTILGHTDQWYQVKGATVTGWIRDDPVLTSPAKFQSYASDTRQFSALYPDTWMVQEAPPASVVFHAPPPGGDSIVVTTAATVAVLGRGRPGYQQRSSETAVVCGVTSTLFTYEQAAAAPGTTAPAGGAAEKFLYQVHLTLDPQHALGIDANLADGTQLPMVRDFVNSVKFPFPKCES